MGLMIRVILFLLSVVCSLEGSVESVENQISQSAKQTGTDEIVIFRNGHEVYHYRSSNAPQSYDLKEMTGLFYSLAIGKLIDQRKIPCLDVRVGNLLSDYSTNTTLRQLLNHTSGLSQKKDLQILSRIIATISNKSTANFMGDEFFVPMDFKNTSWISENGDETLLLSAEELAKVGWLLANNGQWHCKPLISSQWLDILKKPSQDKNPFWGQQIWLEHRDLLVYWDEPLLNLYWKAGMKQNFLCKLAELDGREIHMGGSVVQGNILRLWGRELNPDCYQIVELAVDTYFQNLPFGHFTPGPLKALIGWGGQGQQLIVLPEEKFVGVRLSVKPCEPFLDFIYYVDALSKEYAEVYVPE